MNDGLKRILAAFVRPKNGAAPTSTPSVVSLNPVTYADENNQFALAMYSQLRGSGRGRLQRTIPFLPLRSGTTLCSAL